MADEPNRTANPTVPPAETPTPAPAADEAQAVAPAGPVAVPDAGPGEPTAASDVGVPDHAAPNGSAAGEEVPGGTVAAATDPEQSADSEGLEALVPSGAAVPGGAAAFAEPDLGESHPGPALASIDLLDDVELEVTVELGRAEMYIEDVLRLGVGSVVELDRLAGDPVDIFVNKRLVARGEVLVLNDNFCVRINDIVSPIPELAK